MARPGSEAYGLGQAIASLFAPPDPNIARQRMMENMQIANQGEALIGSRHQNEMLAGGGLERALQGAYGPQGVDFARALAAGVGAGQGIDKVSASFGPTQQAIASGESLRLAQDPASAARLGETLDRIALLKTAAAPTPTARFDIKDNTRFDKYFGETPMQTTEVGQADIGQKIAAAAQNYAQANSANALADARRTAPVAAAGGGSGLPDGFIKVGSKVYKVTDTGGLEVVDSSPGKQIPSTIANKMIDDRSILNKIETALSGVEAGFTDAFAVPIIGNRIPGSIKDTFDPEGTASRQKRAAVSTEITHALAGAALTDTETKRLEPYLPGAEDSDATLKTKLKGLRDEFATIMAEREAFYSPEQGYRPLPPRNIAAPQLGEQVKKAVNPSGASQPTMSGW